MRDNTTTGTITCLVAIVLLCAFVASFVVTAQQKGLAETCATWVILPLLGIGMAMSDGGDLLAQFLCWIGLHDWTRWSNLVQATFEGPDLISREYHTTQRMIQERTCQACGKLEVRSL